MPPPSSSSRWRGANRGWFTQWYDLPFRRGMFTPHPNVMTPFQLLESAGATTVSALPERVNTQILYHTTHPYRFVALLRKNVGRRYCLRRCATSTRYVQWGARACSIDPIFEREWAMNKRLFFSTTNCCSWWWCYRHCPHRQR